MLPCNVFVSLSHSHNYHKPPEQASQILRMALTAEHTSVDPSIHIDRATVPCSFRRERRTWGALWGLDSLQRQGYAPFFLLKPSEVHKVAWLEATSPPREKALAKH